MFYCVNGKPVRRLLLNFILLFSLSGAPLAAQETAKVSVPITLDAPLLNLLLRQQLFDSADQQRDLLDDPSGCNHLLASDPRITPETGTLSVELSVAARAGLAISGGCRTLHEQTARIGVSGRPQLVPGSNAVKLLPQQTWLVGAGGERISSGPLWRLTDGALRSLLQRFVVDLTPYSEALKSLLPDVLPHRSRQQLEVMLDSLAVQDIAVTPEGLEAALRFEVARTPPGQVAEAPLSEEELQQWETRWQLMDSLLVLAVKHFAAATELQPARDELLDLLIESRYRLVDALAEPVNRSDDPVRAWFLQTWERLGGIVRHLALQHEEHQPLMWFTVLTATDALAALDRLGPDIGLEISTDGLRRLARLVSDEPLEQLLRYDESIDPQLQRLFKTRLETPTPEPSALRIRWSLFPRAYAATPAERLNRWSPDRDDLNEYLPMVAQLLHSSVEQALERQDLSPPQQALFRNLVLATAWQESCWRQYVVRDQRLQPLRSSTGDVGLMQINERVWRGMFDLQKLRWDIQYNGNAGTAVLMDYLVKYALRKGEHRQAGGLSNLARASYSAYNGGPSKVSRYRQSGVSAYEKKVDTAFWEKYREIERGNEMAVARCLGGDPANIVARPVTAGAAEAAGSGGQVAAPRGKGVATPAGQWINAQQASHFTLQLAAFSSAESATGFIRDEALADPTHVHAVAQDGGTRYLVLHGSFASRQQAAATQQRYQRFKPWLRSFGDLQRAAAAR